MSFHMYIMYLPNIIETYIHLSQNLIFFTTFIARISFPFDFCYITTLLFIWIALIIFSVFIITNIAISAHFSFIWQPYELVH